MGSLFVIFGGLCILGGSLLIIEGHMIGLLVIIFPSLILGMLNSL